VNTRWPTELPPPGELNLLPTRRVVWGPGSIGRLEEILDTLAATRVLVLTSRSLAEEAELVASVERQCGDRYAARFDQIPAHVPRTAVDVAVAAAILARADTLVAFGGGSVIDAAKAVCARLADQHGRTPAIVAVPTTLSGAEFADHYGVTDLYDDDTVPTKRTHTRQDVTPAVVVLDARLTAATPRWLWAGSGVKALDHAVEGLLCSPPRPVLDDLAVAGIRQLVSLLPVSLDPEAVEAARQACQTAAWHCYFAPASLTLGLSHRIGHVLGGTYGVPHAFTSGLTLPAVVRVTGRTVPTRLALLADALGADGSDLELGLIPDQSPAAVLSRLVADVGLPSRLREVGIRRADVEVIARQVAERYPSSLGQLAGTDVTLYQLLDSIW
jgi:maleylacetate reductase